MPTPKSLKQSQPNWETFVVSKTKYLGSTDITLPRPGKKYVSVYFINSKNGSIPFHVETSTAISSQNINSEITQWHNRFFKKEPIIHTIAIIPELFEEQIIERVKNTLYDKGYVLHPELIQYITTPKSASSYIAFMKKQNPAITSLLKKLAKEIHNKVSEYVNDKSNQAQLLGKKTARELVRKIIQRRYLNNISYGLSLELAQKYDPLKEEAVIVFRSREGKTKEDQLASIRLAVKGLNGDWYLPEGSLYLDKPVTFKPSNSLLNR